MGSGNKKKKKEAGCGRDGDGACIKCNNKGKMWNGRNGVKDVVYRARWDAKGDYSVVGHDKWQHLKLRHRALRECVCVVEWL